MTYKFIKSKGVKFIKQSLLVCAGTITCDSVAGMGSGFVLFKKTFKYNNPQDDWSQILQDCIKNYTSEKEDMPAYLRITNQDPLHGGIATVPVYNQKSLHVKPIHTIKETQEDEYKEALRGALKDAKELAIPLYIQPLGIGVYGWPTEVAARLFKEAIEEIDPNDELNVNILIFSTDSNSNDMLFKTALLRALQGRDIQDETEQNEAPIPPSFWMMLWASICQFIVSLFCCRSEKGISP